MKLKLVCVLFLLFISVKSEEDIDDLSDFDFNDESTSSTEEGGEPLFEDNDVEYSDEEQTDRPGGALGQELATREAIVRQVILNSMKSQEMKDKMARVLPILRVMTPDQKLALATLVTTQVLAPSTSKGLSLDEVSALFGNNPNTTAELMLPISLDVANMFRRSARSEKGPTAEELRGAPPFNKPLMRPGGPGVYRRNIIDRPYHNNKYLRLRKPTKTAAMKEPANCELFTASICLKSHDYPIDAIMLSIRRNKHAVSALLTDMRSSAAPTDGSSSGEPPEPEAHADNSDEANEVRRTGAESGFMCPSVVRYARPQKARATSGQWKYIVNTADHTQTLRLERCLKAGDTCTYLTDNFKSRCVQVYNYHRLLTWDQTNGLHMDIFKVPTCCSCHIDSYKIPYPPHHANHATTSENFPGEEIDNEPAATTPVEVIDPYANSINHNHNHNHYRKELPHDYHDIESTKIHPAVQRPAPPKFDFHDVESTKVQSTTVQRPGLPKYLEAPKPQQTYNKQSFNQSYKRSNTPKPFSSSKRPNRPIRRRQPNKPVRDLTQSESNFGGFTTDAPVSTVTVATKEFTKKVNYNYHPIIDFFKPEHIESRMDVNLGDSDWKPVTSMLLATERTMFKKR